MLLSNRRNVGFFCQVFDGLQGCTRQIDVYVELDSVGFATQ